MSILKSTIWVTFATIVGRGAVVLSGVLVANAFGPQVFAIFAFAHVTATSVANISMLGMMNGLPRFIAKMQAASTAQSVVEVILAITVSLVGLAAAALILSLVPSDVLGFPEGGDKRFLIALTLSIGLNNLSVSATNGLELFSRTAIGVFIMGAVLLVGVLIAANTNSPGLPLLVYVIAAAISAFILLPNPASVLLKQIRRHQLRVDAASLNNVLGYSGPMFVATVFTNTGLWLAGRSLLTDTQQPQHFAEFAVGLQWFGLVSMAQLVVAKAILPRLTRSVYKSDFADQSSTLKSGIFLSLIGSALVLIGLIVVSPLVLTLYGPGFRDAIYPLLILSTSAVIYAPIPVIHSAFIAKGLYRDVLALVAIWWVFLVSATYLLDERTSISVSIAVFVSKLIYLASTVLWFRVDQTRRSH